MKLIAYALQGPHHPLVPAGRRRQWMDDSRGQANRCLPLLMGNQAGWWVLNQGTVTMTRMGRHRHLGDVKIEAEGTPEPPISHFGDGIITWRIPYLFRTEPGWQLLIRGPANLPKHGLCSLEGLVETSWAVQPAFYSAQLTSYDTPVTFEDGEPYCQIVPIKCSELEETMPIIEDLFDGAPEHQELVDEYVQFSSSRSHFNATRTDDGWQKHYFQGKSPTHCVAPVGEHRTKLDLQPFQTASDT